MTLFPEKEFQIIISSFLNLQVKNMEFMLSARSEFIRRLKANYTSYNLDYFCRALRAFTIV